MIRVHNSTEKKHQMLKLFHLFQSFFMNMYFLKNYFLIEKKSLFIP